MESIKEATDWLVAISGLFMPILFIPQIKLLIETKESYSLSLFTIYGSLVIQTLITLQALFRVNYQLAFVQSISISCMLVIAGTVLYYRRWPGGRSRYVSQENN